MRTVTRGTRCSRWSTSKPALAAVAPERVGRVGDLLQLAQHELGHQERCRPRNPVWQTSTMRPSMMTEVSRILSPCLALTAVLGKSLTDMSSSSSRLASVTVAPR